MQCKAIRKPIEIRLGSQTNHSGDALNRGTPTDFLSGHLLKRSSDLKQITQTTPSIGALSRTSSHLQSLEIHTSMTPGSVVKRIFQQTQLSHRLSCRLQNQAILTPMDSRLDCRTNFPEDAGNRGTPTDFHPVCIIVRTPLETPLDCRPNISEDAPRRGTPTGFHPVCRMRQSGHL